MGDDKHQAVKDGFKLPPRYEVRDVLGSGAYGVVCSAVDRERGNQVVAVKKIEGVFAHPTFTKRTLREIRILRLLKHENIISLKSVFATTKSSSSRPTFDDLYLVFDLMQTDLASIIKSPQPISGSHVEFFLYQLLRGLKFLHSAGIIHRDIKPRNLLVNSNCDLKICDMGLARLEVSGLTPPNERGNSPPEMTDYVATRWYRAPEIILQWEGYGKAIDLWAVGCILAELLGRKPIFPGNTADHQITLISEVLGRPSVMLISRCPHEVTKDFLLALPSRASRPLAGLYSRTAEIGAIDLLCKLLRFDPDKRLTVTQCLEHPYMSQLHCPSDEPEAAERLTLERHFPFDTAPQDDAQLRRYVESEVELLGGVLVDRLGETSVMVETMVPPVHQTSSPLTSNVFKVPRPPSNQPPPVKPRPQMKGKLGAPPPLPPPAVCATTAVEEEVSPIVVHTPMFADDLNPSPTSSTSRSNLSLELGVLSVILSG